MMDTVWALGNKVKMSRGGARPVKGHGQGKDKAA